MSLYHRGSLLIPIKFLFLPVERIAVKLNIPHIQNSIKTCIDDQCIYGQCIQYLNDRQNTFCQCKIGWSGKYCNISHICTCSPDSLCLGVDANGRSICVCPMNKFGSQCFLTNNICQSDSSYRCLNGGSCIPSDEHTTSRYPFACICPKGFTGDRCEIFNTQMMLSFNRDIVLPTPTLIFYHFIHLINNTLPIQKKNPKIICQNETSVSSYSSHPFNIAFIELSSFQYYLFIISQTVIHESLFIHKTINSLDRCRSINEIFTRNIIDMHLIQRIKYYQLPCQNLTSNVSCFYDDVYMCLCQDYNKQRFANCFEFNHHMEIDDLNIYPQEIERECPPVYLFNSTTSSTQTTTNDISSIYASDYFLYLFILLFCFI
jgi:hypothetical protein